jgi:Tfp pilus assembly protein PilV
MMRSGFTLVEALACVLVLSIAILAGIGMLLYGTVQAERAQSLATAMATAQTVAYDPQPLVAAPAVWPAATLGPNEIAGWLNGYYVRRREGRTDAVSGSPDIHGTPVHVDVFIGQNGALVASFSTRLVEIAPP